MHPMSKNQFGETPRSQEDLQESIGVFPGDSRKQAGSNEHQLLPRQLPGGSV